MKWRYLHIRARRALHIASHQGQCDWETGWDLEDVLAMACLQRFSKSAWEMMVWGEVLLMIEQDHRQMWSARQERDRWWDQGDQENWVVIGIREEWVDIILHFIINKWREKSEIQQGRLTRGRSVCRIIHVKKAEIAIANLIQQNDHLEVGGGQNLKECWY